VAGSRGPATDDRTIRLVVPAAPEYGRVARTAAAGLALRSGFPYRAIEDLRLAIDETLILLLRPDDETESVAFHFVPDTDQLTVEAERVPAGPPIAADARRRFERLVGPIIDEWDVDDESHVHLVKRAR
jgi:hypothetical protein